MNQFLITSERCSLHIYIPYIQQQSVSETAVYCLLSTVYCLLSTVYYLLSNVYCVLCTVYCLLSTVYHMLSLFSLLSVTSCLKSVSQRASERVLHCQRVLSQLKMYQPTKAIFKRLFCKRGCFVGAFHSQVLVQ